MVKSEFQVVGMTCGHCEGSVSAEISKIHGVSSVAADAQSGTVSIESESELDQQSVADAVSEAGYQLA
ncbi:MAG: heavy metal-associated domain-containing protein [Microbacteriaceae bacterium]